MTSKRKLQPLKIGDIIESSSQADGSEPKRYRLLRRIGSGGYSIVYEAEEMRSGQRFAMKVLQLVRAQDRRSLERCRREGPILFRVHHKNVVNVHDYGVRADGIYWILLDLLVGRTLRDVKTAMGGKIPVPIALEITAEVCAGLAAIHRLNIIHRDIKPENVHVSDDGSLVRLFDLGAAKDNSSELRTTDGYTVGTVAYMSPEQIVAKDLDPSSDVFSVGTLLYELLTGMNPFEHNGKIGADVSMEVGLKVLGQNPVPIRDIASFVPQGLAQVIHKCLRKEKAERYPSAEVLYRILMAALGSHRATHPKAMSLVDVMALLKERAPSTGDMPGLPASQNPFVWDLDADEDGALGDDPIAVPTEEFRVPRPVWAARTTAARTPAANAFVAAILAARSRDALAQTGARSKASKVLPAPGSQTQRRPREGRALARRRLPVGITVWISKVVKRWQGTEWIDDLARKSIPFLIAAIVALTLALMVFRGWIAALQALWQPPKEVSTQEAAAPSAVLAPSAMLAPTAPPAAPSPVLSASPEPPSTAVSSASPPPPTASLAAPSPVQAAPALVSVASPPPVAPAVLGRGAGTSTTHGPARESNPAPAPSPKATAKQPIFRDIF